MAGEGRVGALGEAEVGFGQRHGDGNQERIGAEMAGLAAIDQAGAAEIVKRCAAGIHVDLAQVNVEALDALA